ncbi:hypothetical protein GCM10010358_61930 [Streptomyces minutiscleroticus]|uniref:Uncharacterized protein n=1 Tax=Streptomyces minutiscleroticus TaxID=68238 RepID=A0A918NW72_9ACTN|nr:hypothetical protein GCM10010358_61930 [Streptomyces minutiscleroticus]
MPGHGTDPRPGTEHRTAGPAVIGPRARKHRPRIRKDRAVGSGRTEPTAPEASVRRSEGVRRSGAYLAAKWFGKSGPRRR